MWHKKYSILLMLPVIIGLILVRYFNLGIPTIFGQTTSPAQIATSTSEPIKNSIKKLQPVKEAKKLERVNSKQLAKLQKKSDPKPKASQPSLAKEMAPSPPIENSIQSVPSSTPTPTSASTAADTVPVAKSTTSTTSLPSFNPIKLPEFDYNKGDFTDNSQPLNENPAFKAANAALPNLTPGNITTCGQINSGGTYLLTTDISGGGTVAGSCLVVSNTNNVTIDCGGHSIQEGPISIDPPYSINMAISLDQVDTFTITGCTLDTSIPFAVSNSSRGNINHNNLKRGIVNFTTVTNSEIASNILNISYQQIFTTGTYFHDNTMATPAGSNGHIFASALVSSAMGSNNRFENNQLDGKWDGVVPTSSNTADFVGADDGILISQESGDTFIGNTISNNWDCGFETTGLLKNSTVSNNAITNSGVCGIGAWYHDSWLGNTIDNNKIDKAPTMFKFYRLLGLQPSADGLYFQNNTFTDNKFTNPISGWISSPVSSIFDFNQQSLDSLGIAAGKVHIGNNTFSGNDFGTSLLAPLINPTVLAIDGIGNICGGIANPSQGLTQPLKCGQIVGDGNGDSRVDILDYGVWRLNFGQQNCGNPADYNKDCRVDILDYGIWRANFGVSLDQSQVVAGADLPVNWKVTSSDNKDSISIVPQGSNIGAFDGANWAYYSSCTQEPGATFQSSGTCSLSIPSQITPGNYEVRMYASDGKLVLAEAPLTVTALTPQPTPSPAPSPIALPVACSGAGVSFNQASPQMISSKIKATAQATGCPTPEFKWWILSPGGSWTLLKDWGEGIFNWSTQALQPGSYYIDVWARNSGSTSDYEAYDFKQYDLTDLVTPAPTPSPEPSPTPVALVGDANKDGRVDILDYGVWKQNFGQSDCGNPADFNGDCNVDILDYGIWRLNFGL